jgi:uncharacterized Zn finger protein
VILEGRKIATSFWGKAWCDNLESYRDFAYRLERGCAYARNGSVIDLQILPHEIRAKVMGSELYSISIKVKALPSAAWTSICGDCAGRIDSLIELLQGRLSQAVMDRVCRQGDGLFPKPADIKFSCTCPDSASMCKHVAAALYGVGARFDAKPELLFELRALDATELFDKIDAALPTSQPNHKGARLDKGDLSDIFGINVVMSIPTPKAQASTSKRAGSGAKASGPQPGKRKLKPNIGLAAAAKTEKPSVAAPKVARGAPRKDGQTPRANSAPGTGQRRIKGNAGAPPHASSANSALAPAAFSLKKADKVKSRKRHQALKSK